MYQSPWVLSFSRGSRIERVEMFLRKDQSKYALTNGFDSLAMENCLVVLGYTPRGNEEEVNVHVESTIVDMQTMFLSRRLTVVPFLYENETGTKLLKELSGFRLRMCMKRIKESPVPENLQEPIDLFLYSCFPDEYLW